MTEAPSYRAYVEALISKLAQRAADGEQFARLALPGWQQERARLRGGDAQAPDTTIDDGLTIEHSERT